MKAHIQKWGNSLALRIPRAFAADVHIQEGSEVELRVADGELVVKPIASPASELEQLLAGVTGENLHSEVDAGSARGNEAW